MDISVEDMAALDASIAIGMDRPLGREMMAARLPLAESVFVCLYNLEPAGLIVLHRSHIAAQVRALVVAQDMRRKGLARTMLTEAEERALDKKLTWLWLRMSSNNLAGKLCARSFGFKRYNAQYLHRAHGSAIPTQGVQVRLEPMDEAFAERALVYWLGAEVNAGDVWAQPFIETEMMAMLIPRGGQSWRMLIAGSEIGVANLVGSEGHHAVTLYLDHVLWNSPSELACLRAVLQSVDSRLTSIDVNFGSSGHLRASLARYKELGFTAVIANEVLYIKPVKTTDD